MNQTAQVVLVVVLIVVTVLLVLCHWPDTYPVEVSLNLSETADGKPVIDQQSYHSFAVLGHKDQIEWSCSNCGVEFEFRVQDIRYLGDIDRLANLFSAPATARLGPDTAALVGALAERASGPHEGDDSRRASTPETDGLLQAAFNLADKIREDSTRRSSAEPESLEAPWDPAQAASGILDTTRLMADVPAGREHASRPFGDEELGDEFIAGDRTVKSGPFIDVPAGHFYLYKFTWVVRRSGDDDPSRWAIWDPHFIGGHEKPGG